jgi:CubicO group peptidase (beta-lactamase class C family)
MRKNMYHRIRFVVVHFLVLAAGIAAFAQQAASVNGEEAAIKRIVDRIMQPYMALHHFPGAIVAVSLRGQRYYFPYGQANDAGAPFAPDTLVEIGSCTKTFTTTLFALAINRKQMVPNASIQKYMPAGYTLRPEAQEVTPLELADFTSGLPDDPPNLPQRLEMRGIEHYTTKDFLTWISRWKPASAPPAQYLYSNAGIGLLGYLVMTATNTGWEQQLSSVILDPLGMPDTTLRPSPEQRKRLAKGHMVHGNDAPPRPIYAWYAAGGLRSTAQDMLSFGEANLGHQQVSGKAVSSELTETMELAQKPIYTMPNGRNKQAMAWVMNMGNGNPNLHPVIVKDGGTVGFSTAIALNHSKDMAVFVAVNQSGALAADKAVEIARHLP